MSHNETEIKRGDKNRLRVRKGRKPFELYFVTDIGVLVCFCKRNVFSPFKIPLNVSTQCIFVTLEDLLK